jgi:hypothetical protein
MKATQNKPAPEVLGWRIAEFAKMISVGRATLSRMAKDGELKLIYFGDIPIVPRTEAVRLGLIKA